MFEITDVFDDCATFTLEIDAVINTDDSVASTHVAAVRITGMEIAVHAEDRAGELRVYLDTTIGDTEQLVADIYTDETFVCELRGILLAHGVDAETVADIDYSESGMQGEDYVSFDAYALADTLYVVAVEQGLLPEDELA